ncbi:MAG: VapC toxin family PIN domain ribonuclease, partial [Chloroflexi bacterium]|nr:VapC toxin family PIN domain ribonuclease [Chloroflexota bacterium]
HWATCPITQLGFVRIVTNPTFSRDALSTSSAVALLRENVAHPSHEFWAEDLPVPAAIEGMESGIHGYRQVTDAYLLAVASRYGGVLATFDRGLRSLAGEKLGPALEIVPTK